MSSETGQISCALPWHNSHDGDMVDRADDEGDISVAQPRAVKFDIPRQTLRPHPGFLQSGSHEQ